MFVEKKAAKTSAPTEGRHEKRTDKIKVMIRKPGEDGYIPFLFRLSASNFFQGSFVRVYGRPSPDDSDKVFDVEKIVFRSDKDLNLVVKLMADSVINRRFARKSKVSEEKPDLPDASEVVSCFLNRILNHPAVEVDASLFPGRRHIAAPASRR